MADDDVVDSVALERLLRIGGQSFLLEMIELFLEHAPQRLAAARTALAAGDAAGVYRAAHSLKSTAGNLGASRLQAVAEALEASAAAAGGPSLVALLDEVERCYAPVRDRLEAERRRRRGSQ